MNNWIYRISIFIAIVIGFHLLGFVYIIKQLLPEQPNTLGMMIILFLLLFSMVMLTIFVYFLLKRELKPLEEITHLIKDLTEGYYWRRSYIRDPHQAFYELSTYTNQLAEHLQKAAESRHLNEERLHALIRHMDSGLLFINHKGRIALTNQKLMDLLQWDSEVYNKLYYEVTLDEEIIQVIQDTFTYEQESKKHISLEQGIERFELDLYVAPVKDLKGDVTGIVLVFYDITDLKRLEQMRQDFVANVSHELKTPLTSIKGFSETLLDGAMYSEEHLKQFLEIIRQESDRLHRLIQDLLDLSHLEQKRFQLQWESISLDEIVRDTLMLVQGKAEEKSIVLSSVSEGEAVIEGDSDRLRQIFLNLVTNAIRYTPEEGKVTVSILPWEDKGYQVCVIDTGIGMKKEEIPRIFERFYRIDKARSRESGGTGLGLAIVKHLVEAHHGVIKVHSEEGKGSQFCVYLYKKQQEQFR